MPDGRKKSDDPIQQITFDEEDDNETTDYVFRILAKSDKPDTISMVVIRLINLTNMMYHR